MPPPHTLSVLCLCVDAFPALGCLSPALTFFSQKGCLFSFPFHEPAVLDHDPLLTQALTSLLRYLLEQRDVEVNVRDKWDSTPL